MRRFQLFLVIAAVALPGLSALSAEAHAPGQAAPPAADIEATLKSVRVPQGFKLELWAAEPLLAQPVAISIDNKGRIFVSETHRFADGIAGGGDRDYGALDLRGHMDWLDEDLSNQTVEAREEMLKRHMGEKISRLNEKSEIVRLVEDSDGDGKADRSTIFADGFNRTLDGAGEGVLVHKGNVYFTCIPDLWRLKDTDGDGKADRREILSHGYGPRIAFLGHDLHGLILGPDGKLYYSIGDRGYNISGNTDKLLPEAKTRRDGRALIHQEMGAVFRCNLDGTDLEVFALGLRNPQELAFDQYGNLFAADNNADKGDPARWVYVCEGGDSGWRGGYQFITQPNVTGPWMGEKICYPEGFPAYIVPSIASIGVGPSGIAHYPGTGLGPEYADHFFYCDFRGSSGGVLSFGVRPKGAGFETYDLNNFLWQNQATDFLFGPDGCMYASIWFGGISKSEKGRIYKLYDPAHLNDAVVVETKKLLSEGFDQRPLPELAKLLAHADQRVRQEAQFALAEKGAQAVATLKESLGSDAQLARIHSIWALNQIAAAKSAAPELKAQTIALVLPMLSDKDAEVCVQAAKALGDLRCDKAFDPLVKLLTHENLRVRYFSALSLGKIGNAAAIGPVFEMLRENADKDAFLRHAGVMALTWLSQKSTAEIHARANDSSTAVRLAALLVLRRLEDKEVARFLNDPHPQIALEAARAINDVPINDAMPALAALLIGERSQQKDTSPFLLRRAINANFRQGTSENARTLVAFSGRTEAPLGARTEALQCLLDWSAPPKRDRIMNLYRPLLERDGAIVADAIRPSIGASFKSAPNELQGLLAQIAGKYQIKDAVPALVELAGSEQRSAEARVEALRALVALKDPSAFTAIRKCMSDKQAKVKQEANALLAILNPAEALPVLEAALKDAPNAEKQGIFGILAAMKFQAADAILASWMEKLVAGQVAAELQLDVLQAAKSCSDAKIKELVAKYEQSLPKDDELAPFKIAMQGGNAELGKKVFYENATAQCIRCHKINGQGGDVGPELKDVAARKPREYLLESIILPSAQIAQGYESSIITTNDGKVTAGIIKTENDSELSVVGSDGKPVVIKKADIKTRKGQKISTMPPMGEVLSKDDIRNLVEFLAGLK